MLNDETNVEAVLGDVTRATYFGAEIENIHPDSNLQGLPVTATHENANSVAGEFTVETKSVNDENVRYVVQDKYSTVKTFASMGIFSMIGCLVRIGLEYAMGPSGLRIESSNGVIFQAFVANMTGSFVLGILVGSTLKEINGMLSLYAGISTGLCGSITTFSKFNQQVSLMIIGESNSMGNQFFNAFLSLLLGIAAPFTSYIFGHDLSTMFRKNSNQQQHSNTINTLTIANVINYGSSVLLCICWITLIVISVIYRNHYNVILNCVSVILAPFGSLVRFLLGKLNQRHYESTAINMTPVGTLAANLMGSLILASTHVMLTWVDFSCQWRAFISAIGTGFCACLTTVSTLMSEIKALRDKNELVHSHIYPLCTIALCLGLSMLLNGVSYAVYSNQPYSRNANCTM